MTERELRAGWHTVTQCVFTAESNLESVLYSLMDLAKGEKLDLMNAYGAAYFWNGLGLYLRNAKLCLAEADEALRGSVQR